jgi:hypothetical protein
LFGDKGKVSQRKWSFDIWVLLPAGREILHFVQDVIEDPGALTTKEVSPPKPGLN